MGGKTYYGDCGLAALSLELIYSCIVLFTTLQNSAQSPTNYIEMCSITLCLNVEML